MVDPTELITVARLLSSEGTPSDAALRRAVSTVYYALFHALAAFAADRLIALGAASAAYALVYRGLDHKKIRDALEEAAKPTLKLALRRALGRTSISPQLKVFADTFVPLQQLRHVADYDPTIKLSRSDVVDLIDDAEQALHAFASIPRDEMTDLIAYMLVGARGF